MQEWLITNREIFGLIAGPCTTLGFVLQVIKILRTRQTAGISLSMYTVFCFGVACWILYGVGLDSLTIIVFNSLTLVLGLMVIAAKLRFG